MISFISKIGRLRVFVVFITSHKVVNDHEAIKACLRSQQYLTLT